MDFWYIVDEIDKLRIKYNQPGPLLRTVLEQFSLVDSAHFRNVAAFWGTGGDTAGIPAAFAEVLPTRIEEAVGHAKQRWEGEAFDSFRGWMTDLQGLVGELEDPAQEVGQIFEELAKTFELSWLEIIGLVGGVAGVVLGMIAAGLPEPVVTKAAAVVLEAVGIILGVVGVLVSIIDGVFPRVVAAFEAAEKLGNAIRDKIPMTTIGPIPTPETGDWRRKTTDPYT